MPNHTNTNQSRTNVNPALRLIKYGSNGYSLHGQIGSNGYSLQELMSLICMGILTATNVCFSCRCISLGTEGLTNKKNKLPLLKKRKLLLIIVRSMVISHLR
jgi:hypothetical protein